MFCFYNVLNFCCSRRCCLVSLGIQLTPINLILCQREESQLQMNHSKAIKYYINSLKKIPINTKLTPILTPTNLILCQRGESQLQMNHSDNHKACTNTALQFVRILKKTFTGSRPNGSKKDIVITRAMGMTEYKLLVEVYWNILKLWPIFKEHPPKTHSILQGRNKHMSRIPCPLFVES